MSISLQLKSMGLPRQREGVSKGDVNSCHCVSSGSMTGFFFIILHMYEKECNRTPYFINIFRLLINICIYVEKEWNQLYYFITTFKLSITERYKRITENKTVE